MASKRTYTKKKKKNDPSYKKRMTSTHTAAERFLRFQVVHPGNSGETSHYIDIAKELSKLNRRMYRQGKVYRIANISITSRNTVDGLVSFSTAPDTWVSRNSWIRGFELWNDMNKQALNLQPARKSQWHDFKVYLSDSHRTASAARKPGVLDNGNNAYVDGEWVYSEYISPDGVANGTDAFKAHLVGDHNGSPSAWASVSLIRSYAEARASVQASVPLIDSGGDDDPLLNLFDDGTQVDEIAQNLDSYGDVPPYAWDATDVGENYPGSSLNGPKPIVRRLAAIGTPDTRQGAGVEGVAAPTVMLPGFDAMCGLVEIETQSQNRAGAFRSGDDIIDIVIELAPGKYKGVAAFDI